MPPSDSDVHLDPATAAGAVALRMDRWFAERELKLPAPMRAQFVELGMQALERWPERSTGEVLDQLIAELDARLAGIVAEQAGARGRAAPPRAATGLARWFGRRGDRRH